jgi:hypothetical protein
MALYNMIDFGGEIDYDEIGFLIDQMNYIAKD